MATVPNTFVAGTTALSAEVNENFSDIYSRFLDKTGDTATGTINTQHLLPGTDATYDLGSASFQFRNLYLSGSIIGDPGLNAWSTISVSGQTDVEADSSGDTLTLAAGDGITITTTPASDTITIAATGALAGSSSTVLGQSGVIAQTATTTGNVGTGDDTLWTTTIPANALDTDGACLTGEAAGTLAQNANSKTIRIKFGGTTIASIVTNLPGASATGRWALRVKIKRTGASSQKCWGLITLQSTSGNTPEQQLGYIALSVDLTASSTFAITGEATTTNDIVLEEATMRLEGVPS